ncbi:MAG: 16S rRNA (cytosine(967)-C(5))-methyltransferase RsmB [Lachnospiraceae bacterium]|nr:16S rRNA (cytosine(967)-C(5))-methyltransferase RsmB [Lachnospiraceae bacterium]
METRSIASRHIDLRRIALNLLIRINEEQAFSHLLIREALAKLTDGRDKALVKRLTEGTLEYQIRLDYIINQFAKIPVDKMKPLIRNLLRLSAYQILFMDKIPDRSACDEAVKLAEKSGFSALKGFTNGILRNLSRAKDNLALPSETDTPIDYLSIYYSVPAWLVKKWRGEYSYQQTKSICAGLLEIRPITVRLNGKNTAGQVKAWLENLETLGVEAKRHPYLDYAYQLSGIEDIKDLPGFKAGFFSIQDVSSMLVCEAAKIRKEDLVIDVCAAPGGKALHASEKAKKVIAHDISENKLKYIRENAARLKQDNLEISVYDAGSLDESLIDKADVLLADLPCSGLGVIARKPDIKHRLTEAAISELCDLQRRILGVVWQYVKPGGTLIYSTCTINLDENEKMMAWFTANFPFSYDALPENLENIISLNQNEPLKGMLKLLPGIHLTDGFFICRLRRDD